ncbi:MAG TPA: ACT domain-containing protein [Acetobacteraceae bacterium]|nr:ACT domain-containing protein [Acetobacteraceae bacterium]
MAAPVHELATLAANAQPMLRDGEFGFCCVPKGEAIPRGLTPILWFAEDEGTTLIIPLAQAQAIGIACEFPSRMITLTINSALDAVGFLAAITTRLAAAGISVNAVSAFHHDHIFVPLTRAEEAMELLSSLAECP